MTRKFSSLARVLATLIVLLLSFFPLSAQAQSSPWDSIRVTPQSGNWNTPGYFILTAEQSVTVSWIVKCTFGGCNRPAEEVDNFTFAAGQSITVGWGHQCYAWQFDEIGGVGFIAEGESAFCVPNATPTTPPTSVVPSSTPTSTATPVTTGTPLAATTTATATVVPPGTTATPTGVGPTSTPSGVTPTAVLATATGIAPTPGLTPTAAPTEPAQAQATQVVVLPTTGQAPPPSPLSSPLWPALAALLLLALAGRTVWTGILQAENIQIPSNITPALHSQARKTLILIALSLLILATLVLPAIIHQAALDSGGTGSDIAQPAAIAQPAQLNLASATAVTQPALQLQAGAQPLAQRLPDTSQRTTPANQNAPAVVPAGANQAVKPVDSGPAVRLVIPALKIDAKVQSIPFENNTWDISKLAMDIAWLGGTSSPGLGGNTVLAAHITELYLGNGPFRYLYTLKTGDQVYVYTDQNIYIYSVREQAIVKINDPSVISPTGQSQLTLLTCTGWDNETLQYTKRRAVFADLVSVTHISAQKISGS